MSGISVTKLMPKLQPLRPVEDEVSLENFRMNLLFILSEHERFATLLDEDLTWKAVGDGTNRGFTNDATTVTKAQTAVQKVSALNVMLGIIATYVPVISRKYITEEATSLSRIWQRLRVFYNLRKTGGSVFSLLSIERRSEESSEAFFERIHATAESCLLEAQSPIHHHGKQSQTKESMSPVMESLLVALWLAKIDNTLPDMVANEFATVLNTQTLASIRESINVQALLNRVSEQVGGTNRVFRPRPGSAGGRGRRCSLCLALGKSGKESEHFLSQCAHLTSEDKEYINKSARPGRTRIILQEDDLDHGSEEQETEIIEVSRVQIASSPSLRGVFQGRRLSMLLDTGAEANLISHHEAKRIGLSIVNSRQRASQADGSPLQVVGETKLIVQFGPHGHKLVFEGLVVDGLNSPMIGGIPFLGLNHVHVEIDSSYRKQIFVGDCSSCDSSDPFSQAQKTPVSNRIASILRVSCRTTILPGEEMKFCLPEPHREEEIIAVEPRLQSPTYAQFGEWLQPSIQKPVDGTIRICNDTDLPIRLARSEQFCNVRRVSSVELNGGKFNSVTLRTEVNSGLAPLPDGAFFSDEIGVDPDNQLTTNMRDKFVHLNRKFDSVFSPGVGTYNGHSGPLCGKVVMGPSLPPQRKGRVPQYAHSDLDVLQTKFDELEAQGVIAKPDEIGVDVEYLNPSFLVKKPNGGHRLVTSFGEVAQYSKPQPSLLPSVDKTLRSIGQWRYLAKTDLSQAYYQIPMNKTSMRFLGICTPFNGIRVYQRCGMGMPGSETALEEMMSNILGGLVREGKVAKLADDLYCGGASPEEVLDTWENVLSLLAANGLKLSPSKTVCCPRSTVVLGWIWSNGTLTASAHRLSALETCERPENVKGLRSFVGAYKFLSRVLPGYSDVLHPLDAAVAGRESKEKLIWTAELEAAFCAAQAHLKNAKTIYLPRRDDHLRIITDAAGSKRGLAATLLIVRGKSILLAGFFNVKLKNHQLAWLPCEVEGLCIGAAVNFFSASIVDSNHRTIILTDSRPCVQAYAKLCRGEFSSSSRVLTFLSALSNYGIKLEHLPGSQNALSDFGSRNPIECEHQSCQVCHFVQELQESPVRVVTVPECEASKSIDVYHTRPAWKDLQRSCADLRRTHAHLRQGTEPSRKARDVKDVRRYLSAGVRISPRDGLLVVHVDGKLRMESERIVIPRALVHGVLTAIHLKLNHPSRDQLKKVVSRTFFAINLSKVIDQITTNCDACGALKKVPTLFTEQSTSDAPDSVGVEFSADVVRRSKQMILLVREKVTSFTATSLIKDETGKTLRDGLLKVLAPLRDHHGRKARIRVDPAPGFQSIRGDAELLSFGIQLELGQSKNPNKNPISERGIQELHAQLKRIQPQGGSISETVLALATAGINSQLRNLGLSSNELWTHRDQYSGKQIPVSDLLVIKEKQKERLKNHYSSAKYRARGKTEPKYENIQVGHLVYLYSDGNKLTPRDRYLVCKIEDNYCTLKKFVGRMLRSHDYVVNMTDCYKVQPTVKTFEPPQSDSDNSDVPQSDSDNSDVHSSDSESENEQFDNDQDNDEDNVAINDDNSDDNGIGNDIAQQVPPENYIPVVPGRPRRQLRRPKNLENFELDFSSDED